METVAKIIAFFSDLLTVVLGCVALYGLIFHRRAISNFVRLLQNYQLTERVQRIKETLGKLDSLNYGDKEARAEIIALLGQVAGQVHPLIAHDVELQSVSQEISDILAKRVGMNEATKRRIVYQIHGHLETRQFDSDK